MNKKIRKAAPVLLAVIIISVFSGCYMLMDALGIPMTIDQRIASFAEDLSSESRTAVLILVNFVTPDDVTNYGATPMSSYDQAVSDDFWDSSFDKTHTFTFTDINSSNPSAVSATMKETYKGQTVSVRSATFVMWENPDTNNYKIQSFALDGSTVLDRSVKF